MVLWVNSWALLDWGLLWTCSHPMLGAAVLRRPDRDGCSVWLTIDGWPSTRTLAGVITWNMIACACGLSFSQKSSWDLRGSILRTSVLRCRCTLHRFLWTICLTVSLLLHSFGQASHWGQPKFKRRVFKLYLFIGSGIVTSYKSMWEGSYYCGLSLEYIICHWGQLLMLNENFDLDNKTMNISLE